MQKTLPALLTVGLLGTAATVLADAHVSPEQLDRAVKARKAHMQLYSFNLGLLGAMAKEETPYDADAASMAASSLVLLATMPQNAYWLPGTDSAAFEGSRAKPEIWTAESNAGQYAEALAAAAMEMEQAASTSLDALKAAMGPLGSACGDCHDDYRVPRN